MNRNKIRIISITSAVLIGASALIAGCAGNQENNKDDSKVEKSTDTNKSETSSKTESKENTDANKSDQSENSEFAKNVSLIHEKVKEHWPHMDKVWPTYNYDNHNFVLMNLNDDQTVKEAWVINSKEKRKLTEKEYEKIEAPQVDGYVDAKFDGKPSIVISFDDSSFKGKNSIDEIYRLATHELVHFYYQEDVVREENSSRTQKYPSEETPRIYRRMIYNNLIKAYETPENEEEYLSKAKYWLEKWKTEFPDEYKQIKPTDIEEATARYTENIGIFIKDGLSDEEFKENAIKSIKKDAKFETSDEESYEIGYVAGLILDKKQPEWKKEFYKEGNTVEEKLLENIKPVEEEVDPEVKEKVTAIIDKYNKFREEKIKDIISSDDDKSIPYLRVNITKSLGSDRSQGALEYKEREISLTYINQFKVDGKNLELNKVNVINEYDEKENIFVTVPLIMDKSSFEYKDGKLSVKSDNIKADSIKVKKTEEDGRTIYTAVVGE